MNARKTISTFILVLLLIVALYDIEFVFDVALPSEAESLDPVVEADYGKCYQEKDDQLHATAFATIDNPDVQREFISSNQARAAMECRNLFPATQITVREPARFNLVDLRPRFW